MYDIFPLILILSAFGTIIYITIKKFPALASLDVENIPAEKEARFKEKILSDRLKNSFFKWWSRGARLLRPVGENFFKVFSLLRGRIVKIRENYKAGEKSVVSAVSKETAVKALVYEAGELMRGSDLDGAEKKLIEAISLDNKSVEAFWLLGDLYCEEKSYDEARQTLAHILKLENREDEEVYYRLAKIEEEVGDYAASLTNTRKALDISPNNPRFLDMLFNISIINGDVASAREALEGLKEANPENEKIGEMEETLRSL